MDNYKHLKYCHILNDRLFFIATNILPTISIHSGHVVRTCTPIWLANFPTCSLTGAQNSGAMQTDSFPCFSTSPHTPNPRVMPRARLLVDTIKT